MKFSNGTEGDMWQDVWCAMCANDHSFHEGQAGDDGGCEVWLRCLSDQDTPELVATPFPSATQARWYCTSFTPCEQCGGDAQAGSRARLKEESGL